MRKSLNLGYLSSQVLEVGQYFSADKMVYRTQGGIFFPEFGLLCGRYFLIIALHWFLTLSSFPLPPLLLLCATSSETLETYHKQCWRLLFHFLCCLACAEKIGFGYRVFFVFTYLNELSHSLSQFLYAVNHTICENRYLVVNFLRHEERSSQVRFYHSLPSF